MARSVVVLFLSLISLGVLLAQELPLGAQLDSSDTGTSSPGKGTATLILSSDRSSLRYTVTVNRLQGNITAAHFHDGRDGSVLHPITFTGKTASGTWAMPDSVFDLPITENLYINVHTTSAAGGEIRGTINPQQYGFGVIMDGAQASTASPGKGNGWVTFSDSSGVFSIAWRLTYGGLQGTYTMAHFHSLPGGGIEKTITFTDSTSEEEWVNPPDDFVAKLLRGKLYVNVHTTTAAGGEIRGGVGAAGEFTATGTLDGAQAGTAAAGRGTIWSSLRPDGSIRYSVTSTGLTGSITGSHFHTNRTGGVVHGVTMTNNHATGTWSTPTDQDVVDYVRGRLYYNVHTAANSGGEIRANLSLSNGTNFGILDGAQASTASSGKGTVWLRFSEDSVEYCATYAGLQGTYSNAHFHLSPGGSVIVGTPFINAHAHGWWNPDNNWYQLLRGNVYLNVHSSTNPGGEIRANLVLGTGIPTSVDGSSPELPQAFSLSQNYPNPFNPTTTIRFDLPRAGRAVLRVFNVLGQTVSVLKDEQMPAGSHTAVFEARTLATGIYFYALAVDGEQIAMRRMVLIK